MTLWRMQAPAGAPTGGFTLPVALKGLHHWAAVIGTMCEAVSGDSAACLHEYFNHTSTMLDSLVSPSDAHFSPITVEACLK